MGTDFSFQGHRDKDSVKSLRVISRLVDGSIGFKWSRSEACLPIDREVFPKEGVERARKYLIGSFEIGLQTNGALANQMSLDELYGLGFDHYQKYSQEIQKITREEVYQVAKKYFNLDAYALAIIRPQKGK